MELLNAYAKYQLGCPDEANFNEIYLQERDEQLRIWDENPEKLHCQLLEHNPRACVGCGKNPREGERAISNELVEENSGILNFVLDICSSHEAGLTVPQSLHPCHAKLIQLGTTWMKNQRDEHLSKLIGLETAKIIGKIFGGSRRE